MTGSLGTWIIMTMIHIIHITVCYVGSTTTSGKIHMTSGHSYRLAIGPS